MISERGHRVLSTAGAFFLAMGVAARFLLAGDLEAVVEATAIGLLMLGSGMLLLNRVFRGGASPVSACILAMPLVAVWAARSLDTMAVKRSVDVWAACLAGFAVRDLARARGLEAEVRATIATAAVTLGSFGVAQTLYLRREVASIAHELEHEIVLSEMGRAFLGSWRAAATFISPNAFGGFLLLFGIPVVWAAAARPTPARLVLGAVVVAAFLCAGSAGAAIVAAFGACAVAARGRRRALWLAGAGVIVALAVTTAIVAATGSGLSGKLRTLQERMDYQMQGLRLLRSHWVLGAGLERTGGLVNSVRAPGEATSRFLHDWWLQGFVEGGLAFVPVAIALAWAIWRAARAGSPTSAGSLAAVRGLDRVASMVANPLATWWRRGLVAGAAIALAAQPFVTVLPYGFGHPLLHVAIAVAVATIAWRAALRIDVTSPSFTTGLAAGAVAFGLHGFVDFDLYIPGVMLAFAMVLAVLPAPPAADSGVTPPCRIARALLGSFGFVALLAPIGVLLFAKSREHVH